MRRRPPRRERRDRDAAKRGKGGIGGVLIAYADTLSARPGEAVTVRASTDAETFAADLVRLLGPAPRRNGARDMPVEPVPETRVDGIGGRWETRCGSFGWAPDAAPTTAGTFAAWVWLMARGAGAVQGIVARREAATGLGFALALDEEDRPCLLAGPSDRLTAARPLPLRGWHLLAGGFDAAAGALRLHVIEAGDPHLPTPPRLVEALRASGPPGRAPAPGAPLVVAAAAADDHGPLPHATGLLTGKLEAPLVLDALLDDAAALRLAAGDVPAARHRWDLGADPDGEVVPDRGTDPAPLRLVNAPTRAMTGHRFTGRWLDPRGAPAEYAAAHFHADDLDDARWPASATLRLPADLRSGVYAIRLTAGDEVDHVPLCVPHDRRGGARPRHRVAFLLPTLTHVAYANARGSTLATPGFTPTDDALHTLFDRHPEWGSSLYDVHADGSGVSVSTARRPLASLRPSHWSRSRPEPVHLAADLAVVAWLERTDIGYDALCDHDLHADGAAALDGYDVLVTGAHPEYCTEAMLDATLAFQRAGGSVLSLGGNGFYWVTAISPSRPHLVEVRRGHGGGRAWTGEPGEEHLATTGEPGGLWRHRGRPPQQLVGVGFAAMGVAERWPGYRLLADASDPRVAFLFEGLDRPPSDGSFLAGAAGNELDRADPALGTPAHALRVATSEGLHDDRFATGPEDVPMLGGGAGFGGTDPRVRADLVFYETGFGGAVVAVGSIAWASALHREDVDRLTTNALRRMLNGEPFRLPEA